MLELRCLKPVPWVAIAQIFSAYGMCISKYSTDTFLVFEHQAYFPFKRADEGGNDGSKNEDAEKLESGKLSSTPKGESSQETDDKIENNAAELHTVKDVWT